MSPTLPVLDVPCRLLDVPCRLSSMSRAAGSDEGGKTAATLMSLCTTCKTLGIDPDANLRNVLDRISTHPARQIDDLLPDRRHALRRADATAKS